jgi:hypothetical protein
MKRILLPLLLLACAAACAPAPSNNANTNANVNASNVNAANTNASSSATASDADLIAKEREIYDNLKKKDSAAFGAMLGEDFIYVTSDGIYDKAGTIKDAGTVDFNDVSLTDFKVLHIDTDAAVITYTSDIKSTSGGKSMAQKAHESSVWVNRGGKWVALFHQDCEVHAMPAPAGASANTNTSANSNKATTAASPASAAATTTADAEANEKMVWDALKRKDANGFANFLADDALEVEQDKVYTKSESTSTVPTLAFLSTVTIGDFQTKKIDADASIVTYTVKGTGPDKKPFTERHSTVWANRGGKWLAVFHHGGTEVAPPRPTK